MSRKNALFLLAAVIMFACGCKLSGKVDMDGVGLKDITIILQGDSSMQTVTDKDGRFAFHNLKAGSYTVTLQPVPGWTRPVTRYVIKEKDYSDVTGVDFSISSATERQTTNGGVIGFTEGNGCSVWLGIPYAQAPVGNFRWKAPQPALNWSGLWLALGIGPLCTQLAGIVSDVPKEQYGQPIGCEDCLFLNVWAPGSLSESSGPLPVMLWIHGGGNTIGHGGGYNGKILAEKHNVIVITFNYRLGPFGWFAHPALRGDGTTPEDQSGNYGTLDIIHVMTWVRDNIASFGGDPDNVTIFGESAGAQDVLTMMLSPKAKGLFHRAVVQSGGLGASTMSQAENYKDDTEPGDNFSSREVVNMLLMADGIVPDRQAAKAYQDQMDNEELAEYLRSKSNYDFLNIYEEGYGGMIPMPKVFKDGLVMPQGDYLELLKDTANFNSVPIILGTNRDEYKLFMILNPDFVDTLFGLPLHIRNKKFYNLFASYMSDRWKATGVDDIASALSNAQSGNVWAYRFDWDEEPCILGIDVASMVGAAHSMEIPFVFNNFDKFMAPEFTPLLFTKANAPGRAKLAESMSSYWAEFAYTGSPGKGRSGMESEWRPWGSSSPEDDKFIIFDTLEDGGNRMSKNIITLQALKYRLLVDAGFPGQKEHCKMYVTLFAGTDLWDDEEYDNLGKCGCRDYPVD